MDCTGETYCGFVTEVRAVRGDITQTHVDAIVNAANSSLLGGGGVDGAIHRAAGPALLDACRALRATALPDGLPTGEAVITPGFALPAPWVVHTVGPVRWEHPDGGRELLRACHVASLRAAAAKGARTIAFPAISCGVYGWDAWDAAPIAVDAVRTAAPPLGFTRVEFVLFNDDALAAFLAALRSHEG